MPIAREGYEQLHLLPSILSADFSRLGEQISAVMDAGVRGIHFDVMDGHFVPNLTIGPVVLESVAPIVHSRGGFFSVHLMIEKPERYAEAFVKAGADAVSLHVEACPRPQNVLMMIKSLGAGAGIAINPDTGLSQVAELLALVDFVVVMTVNPGFGGQSFISSALDKVPELRKKLPSGTAIEIDGGINRGNIRQVVEAGANWVVAGSAVFKAADPAAEAQVLQNLMFGHGR